MAKDVISFDANAIKDKVAEEIRKKFMELVPEEAWKQLVSDEVDAFLEKEVRPLIGELIKRKAARAIVKELSQPDYSMYWHGNKEKAGVMVQRIIKELAPTFVEQMFGMLVQESVNRLRNDLQQGLIGRGY